jgi:hypothetical protein
MPMTTADAPSGCFTVMACKSLSRIQLEGYSKEKSNSTLVKVDRGTLTTVWLVGSAVAALGAGVAVGEDRATNVGVGEGGAATTVVGLGVVGDAVDVAMGAEVGDGNGTEVGATTGSASDPPPHAAIIAMSTNPMDNAFMCRPTLRSLSAAP